MSKLSIIIPTYNERENLGALLERIFSSLGGLNFEVIVVDDNSPDGTGKLADEIASKRRDMKVVHRERKLGLGTAILDGIRVAEGEFIGVMDADMQHPPELLKTMLEKAGEGADIVIASRYVEGGKVDGWSFVRRATSKGALWLSHLLLPRVRKIKDTLSGYFIFKKSVIEGISLNVKGFKLLIEILARGKYEKVVEVPYTFRARAAGRSKLSLSEKIDYLKQILRLSDYRIFKFTAVGVSGLVVNNGVLWLLVSALGAIPFLAGIFSIEASILSNFALNNFWTFKDRKGGSFLSRMLKYHGSVALGAVVNYATLVTLTIIGLHLIVANTIGIFLGFISNYLLSETFVWKWR